MRAKHRRIVHLVIALIWLGPGAVTSYFLRDSVPWVVGMSWFACVYAAVSAWAAETPVEEEDEAG